MSKFKVGQKVKLTQQFLTDYERLFKKLKSIKYHEFVVLSINDDGIHTPIYFATHPDRYGNCEGFAEQFLEAVQ